jgi:hypothetical protein
LASLFVMTGRNAAQQPNHGRARALTPVGAVQEAAMRLALTTFALAASLAAAAAQEPPRFDAAPGCRAGANTGVAPRSNIDACLRSEHDARDAIARQWGEFAAADKSRCVEKTHMGGPPSYIEVLTCLELARDARKLPKDDNTGLSTGLRR